MINSLSASAIYTQNSIGTSSKVEKGVKTNKVESTKIDELKQQISSGQYKLDMKATAQSICDAIL